jgi:hypothetical protein
MNKKENIDNPTDEQIEQWKKEYGEVYTIEVAEEAEKYDEGRIRLEFDEMPKIIGYLKKPDRMVMNYALTSMSRNVIDAGKSVLKNCWLGGDMRILDNPNYLSTAALQAIDLVDVYQSRLKKL